MCTGKSDETYVKLKFLRYPTSITLYLYDFKMSFFDHGNPEEFVLFVYNFKITLVSTRIQDMDAKIKYLCMLVHLEVLHQFGLSSADVENMNTLSVDYYFKGLSLHYPPVNLLKKAQCAAELKPTQFISRVLCGMLD